MGSLCIAIGLGITGIGVFNIYLLLASLSWRRTMGHVLKSSASQDTEMNVWPLIEYSYMVDGQEYSGKRIYAGGMWSLGGWYRWVYDLLEQHPVGSQIQVFYDPSRPKLSCLRREGWPGAIGLCGVGVGFIVGGFSLLYQ